MAYDGSINIDTRIDTKNFNVGIKRINQGMKSALLGVAVAGMQVAVAAAAIAAAFAAAAGVVAALGVRMFKMLSDSISRTSEYYSMVQGLNSAFDNLKGAFLGAFGTLLNAAMPAILTVINWLTRLVNLAAQFIAALTGQKTYMKYVEGSAEAVAKSTGKAAKNTKEQEKAARGSLAAFDQIDVLEQKRENEEPDIGGIGGMAGGGPMQFEETPIEDKVMGFADRVKGIWNSIKQWATDTWAVIQEKWKIVKDWFMENVWKPISDTATSIWNDTIMPAWTSVKDWFITQIWTPITDALKSAASSIGQSFSRLYNDAILPFWNNLRVVLDWLWGIFSPMISNVMTLFRNNFTLGFGLVISLGKTLFESLRDYIIGIIKVFEGLIMFISGVFTGNWRVAWNGIKTIFEGVWMQIKSVIRLAINSIVDMINSMIRGFSNSLNTMIGNISGLTGRFGINLGLPSIGYFQIPRLATGAVIPPNAEFAAILGDQRAGRNLEAPEGLIRQIIQEELGNIQTEVSIGFTGSLSALVRELKPYIDQENVRIGSSLIKKAAA